MAAREATTNPGRREPPAGAVAPGSRLGRYIVLGHLGEGGMGVVYRAHDPDLHREIAVKLVRSTAANPSTQARLLREAQALARLSHPNVIAVHDVGVVDDQLFLAMELVLGGTLRDAIRRAPGRKRILELFLAAGRGLAAAHRAGIIHHDFKPDNVLVGEDGRVRVTDFGLAGAAGDPESGEKTASLSPDLDARLTETGSVMGTPAYMAPEQHAGRRGDARSDQFSFAVALYEALYGERPFAPVEVDGAGSTIAAVVGAALGQVRPPPAGRRAPAWLRRALVRALDRDPERRWPSMDALLGALAADPWRRVRLAAVAVGVTGVAAVGIAGLVASGRGVAPSCGGAEERLADLWSATRQEAVRKTFTGGRLASGADTFARFDRLVGERLGGWRRAYTETCEATRVHGTQSEATLDLRMQCLERRRRELDALIGAFAHGGDGALVDEAVVAVLKLPSTDACADVERLGRLAPPPGDPAIAARVETARAELDSVQALVLAGRFADANRGLDQLQTRVEAIGFAPLSAETLALRGAVLGHLGRHEEAVPVLERALATAAAVRDDHLYAEAVHDLAWELGVELGRHVEALPLTRIAEDAAVREGNDPGLRVDALDLRANVLDEAGDLAGAESAIGRAVALAERPGDRHAELRVARLLTNMGGTLRKRGRHREAQQALERALATFIAIVGPEHPYVAATLNNLGNALDYQGQYPEAVARYQAAAALKARLYAPDHPTVATTLYNLGATLQHAGRHGEARDVLAQALAIREKALGPKHPRVANALALLAVVQAALADHAEARRNIERARDILLEVYGPKHHEVATVYEQLAEVAAAAGRLPAAFADIDRAIALRQQLGGAEHPETLAAEAARAQMRSRQGRCDLARPELERLLATYQRVQPGAGDAIGTVLHALGRCDAREGAVDRAIERMEAALAAKRTSGAPIAEIEAELARLREAR